MLTKERSVSKCAWLVTLAKMHWCDFHYNIENGLLEVDRTGGHKWP